ncbi:MAG: hypothetical protein C0453_08730 [Comamonadaceae bacterium]|nr:hypothetical protein [Comamonadaceae bacterium]
MDFDLIIVGAGPAGLCLARALRDTGLRICLIEKQAQSSLQQPAFDGREIALTHHSASLLQQLGIWSHLSGDCIAAIKVALVMNGPQGPGQSRMAISHSLSPKPELGHLVGNHHIRRAAWAASFGATGAGEPPELLCGESVSQLRTDAHGAHVTLESGRQITARLVVAADSRHSTTRRHMGINADLHDYGRSMVVTCMTHDKPHHATAVEWFDQGQTIALLPMNPCPVTQRHRSSVVLTLAEHELQPLMALDDASWGQAMTRRCDHRLGAMQASSTRHTYPLVGVWARRFVAQRFALVGDAAVGMHPVTAHGFNLGLRSVEVLSRAIRAAHQQGQDMAAMPLLQSYQQTHRRASRGLFLATHALATLYIKEQAPARLLRHALVRLGEHITPFKKAVARSLTGLA